jgi:hypothetical protein
MKRPLFAIACVVLGLASVALTRASEPTTAPSTQPVNKFCAFHSLWPWRSSTSVDMSRAYCHHSTRNLHAGMSVRIDGLLVRRPSSQRAESVVNFRCEITKIEHKLRTWPNFVEFLLPHNKESPKLRAGTGALDAVGRHLAVHSAANSAGQRG